MSAATRLRAEHVAEPKLASVIFVGYGGKHPARSSRTAGQPACVAALRLRRIFVFVDPRQARLADNCAVRQSP